LLNALLEKERSIVTDIPGTTRDVIEETIDIKSFPVVLMDTAGIRAHSQDPVEKIGQNRTVEALNRAQVVVWVLDSSINSHEADLHIYKTLLKPARDKVVIPVWNKTDLPFKADEKYIMSLLSGDTAGACVNISAKRGAGIDELENAIVAAFSFSGGVLPEAVTSNARHIDVLSRAKKALNEAVSSIETGHSEEIPAMHLRDALGALGEITGETATEEILENIFRNFCVGK
jgi:tRNA modification GTPase